MNKHIVAIGLLICSCGHATAQIPRRHSLSGVAGTEGLRVGRELNVSGRDLKYSLFEFVDLRDSDFSGTDLRYSRLHRAGLSGVDLTDADIRFIELSDLEQFQVTQLYTTRSYRDRDLSGIEFWDQDVSGAQFAGQNLTSMLAWGANFSGADFTDSDLTDASFTSGSVLQDATFANATIDRASFRTISKDQLYSTASFANKQLPGIELFGMNLAGWDLSQQSMVGASLASTQLADANFGNSDLRHARFQKAKLDGAVFQNAALSFADLRDSIGILPQDIGPIRNLIQADGKMNGLRLNDGEHLRLNRPSIDGVDTIAKDHQFAMSDQSVLEFSIRPDFGGNGRALTSRVAPSPEASVDLGGTLRVLYTSIGLADGTIYDLFDWNRELPNDQQFDRIELPAGNWDLTKLYTTGEITLVDFGTKGDFNASGILDSSDVSQLSEVVRSGANQRTFDANRDGEVGNEDINFWVYELMNTYFGDANLDGEFSSSDFVQVFASGKFEDRSRGMASWAEGDWDGNGYFETADFVKAFTDGSYEQGPRAAVPKVPEPNACTLAALGIVLILRPLT